MLKILALKQCLLLTILQWHLLKEIAYLELSLEDIHRKAGSGAHFSRT